MIKVICVCGARPKFIEYEGADSGKELEDRIIAVHKAGDGEPSNTVMVVL